MRVLLYEQWHTGHYYHCLSHILPRLIGLVDEVVVAVTAWGRGTTEFQHLIEPFAGRIRIDASIPRADPRMALRDRLGLYTNLRGAVDRLRPDYVLVPSADGQTTMMGLYRAAGRGGLPRGVRGEAGIHYILGPSRANARDYLKDLIYETTYRLSSWERLHFTNMCVYESIRSRGGALARRAALMPYPIPPNPRLDKGASRRALGIPEGGRYMGLVAEIDRRKAIAELLHAFRAGTSRPDDRLLLAGRLHPDFAGLIGREYADLVREGRIILLDRFIGLEEGGLIHSALDVVCTPYPRFGHLSSALLHGVAGGCPILANDFGWPREIVRRFGLGWLCDVLDRDAFTRTLREAFERCQEYRPTEGTRRLLAFHSPENYAETWLARLRQELGRPAPEPVLSWDWVLEGLAQESMAVV